MRTLLRRKFLLASVIFIAILPVLASAFFITYRTFQQAKLNAIVRAKALLAHATEKQEELVAQTLQSLRILAQLPEVVEGGKSCSEFFKKFIEKNPYYTNAGVVDAKGGVVCNAHKLTGKANVSDREWFSLAIKTKVGQIDGLQIGFITGKPSIVAAIPVLEDDKVISVLYLSLSVGWLEDIFAGYSLPGKSLITALDAHGIVLFQHPQKVEGEPSLVGKEFPNKKVWNHIERSGSTIVPARVYEDGGRYVYTFQRIEAEERVAMVIALRFEESEIYREATRDAMALLLGLALSLIATFLVAYVAGNYLFLRPVEEEIEKLSDAAEKDILTGILNRGGFTRIVEEALYTVPLNHSHALLLLDIDHFKKVNDTHGHQIGDMVLKETVERIRGVLRESEIFSRIGGEEFAIFIPNVTRENAFLLAERVRLAAASHPYKTKVGDLGVTLSVGICHATGRLSLEKFLERADKALYRSKNQGRNRVSV